MSDLCWKLSVDVLSSSNSYYDLLKVVNEKVEYLRVIPKQMPENGGAVPRLYISGLYIHTSLREKG